MIARSKLEFQRFSEQSPAPLRLGFDDLEMVEPRSTMEIIVRKSGKSYMTRHRGKGQRTRNWLPTSYSETPRDWGKRPGSFHCQ